MSKIFAISAMPVKRVEALVSSTTSQPPSAHLGSSSKVLLEGTKNLVLLGLCLVGTVTELGGGVDPFEVDLLQRSPGCLREHGLAESHDALLHARNGALEEDKVVVYNTVSHEAAHAVCR